MKVELLPHKGINMATREEETLPQYLVVVDGKTVGIKDWKAGTKIVFIHPVSPKDAETIKAVVEAELGELVNHINAPDEDKIIAKYGDISEPEDDGDFFDDFN